MLAGDRRVANELTAWALPRLCRTLEGSFRRVDVAMVEDGAEDAVLRYLSRPAIWQPSRGSLLTFLAAVARKRLLTRLAGNRRRERRDQAIAALQSVSGGLPAASSRASQIGSVLRRSAKTPEERQFVEFLLDGERRMATYAGALGITSLSVAEQRRQVTRVRARLLVRAKRALALQAKGGRK